MPYLIDGHNLIPKLPGLDLRQMDDEQALLERLQEFCRRQRKPVEVFFDNAPPGSKGKQRFGALLIAHFVRRGTTADTAIRLHLDRLSRAARNWTVVSSDLAVQGEARAHQARVMSSEDFAQLLQNMSGQDPDGTQKSAQEVPSAEEVEEWLQIFQRGKPQKPGRPNP